MNFNGFYALYCTPNGYAQIPWTVPSNHRFSVCIRFLPDAIAANGTLLSFGSVFRIRILDGQIKPGESGPDSTPEDMLLPRCQNTVAVICDGTILSVYCNGAFLLQQAVPDALDQITYVRAGEALSGVCIEQVTLFHRILTPPEIQTSQVKSFSGFHRQIDFTAASVPADVTLHQCRIYSRKIFRISTVNVRKQSAGAVSQKTANNHSFSARQLIISISWKMLPANCGGTQST